jgi:hypothetical protein
MKQKKMFLITAMLLLFMGASAQSKNSYLTVVHSTSGTPVADEIAFNGGEITILNNTVTVAFAEKPSNNRTYDFDKIISFAFETRIETAISTVEDVVLSAFIDKSNILHIQSAQAIGRVQVYSIVGTLVALSDTQSTVADINLSHLPTGIYLVKTGDYTQKIIKQ